MTLPTWSKYALIESLFHIGSRCLQKSVGKIAHTATQVYSITISISICQIIFGYKTSHYTQNKLLENNKYIFYSTIFGVLASLGTITSYFSFMFYGGDLGLHTFLIILGVIPGLILDKIFFQVKLSLKQITGCTLGILAGYIVLETPDIKQFLELPTWIYWSSFASLCVAINQSVSKNIKDISPYVKNFWVGISSLLTTIIILVLSPLFDFSIPLFIPSKPFLIFCLLSGAFVIGLVSFNIMVYKKEANIAIKKMFLDSINLIAAVIIGRLIFKEYLNSYKIVGCLLLLPTMYLLTAPSYKK